MKRLFLVTLLLSAYGFAQAQINGLVVDAETQKPLQNATIQLLRTNKSVISNLLGTFRFKQLKETKYTIKISFVGYETYEGVATQSNDTQTFGLTQKSIMTDEVIIRATRARDNAPMTFSTVTKAEIKKLNTGKDFPYMLEQTASVVTTSDAGAGVGYTGIRIRGSDATRINVTLNGIPYNDSESQGVFWVNLPDMASSVESVQVQRGVGTSTNGPSAFGASINIQTSTLNPDPYVSIDNSFGTFNTRKHTVLAGTGLLNNKFTMDVRLSNIASDGYVDRASSDLRGFYISGGYYGKKSMLKLNIFSGNEVTYQSWYGVPESRINNDAQGMQDYIDRNGLDTEDADNLLNSGRTYNRYTYDNQVDNYTQTHYQLLYAWDLSDKITWNTALHYTKGAGYYEQFKKDEDFEDYGFERPIIGNDTISSTDLIRRRWLDNDFYGVTFSMDYNPSKKMNLLIGGAWNQYDGDHFGELIWAQHAGNTSIREQYYDNNGFKTDFTMYGKLDYQLNKMNLFVDLQYRNVDYTLHGIDNDLRLLNEDHQFNFFNPKVGVTYALTNNSNVYASYSVGNKEPNRNDFVDSPNDQTPKHETLNNIEAGYRTTTEKYWLRGNFYLMDYRNQLVQTGALNDVGASVRTNVDKSHRMGIEIETGIQVNSIVSINANLTLSRNTIERFEEVVYDYGNNWDEFNVITNSFEDTQIAFSPNITAGATLAFRPIDGLEIDWIHRYVGKQYLDNTANENRKLDAYYVSDLRGAYGLSALGMKRVTFTVSVYNLFNKLYSANGYTWGYQGGGNDIRENFYYPQAGTHFMAGLRIDL